MGKIESFEELDCWQSAKELTMQIYSIFDNKEWEKEFTAKDQLKRAALSSNQHRRIRRLRFLRKLNTKHWGSLNT